MGEHRIDWVANEGARISRIVRHVKQQNLTADIQRRLRNEMFDAEPFNVRGPGSLSFGPPSSRTRCPPRLTAKGAPSGRSPCRSVSAWGNPLPRLRTFRISQLPHLPI